ncbi:MAG TPA: CooT family nickel-binding protein [Desulfurivibrio alkaliphilus]|uniref:CooT family nickel-binding protein n=1 Tax=Desulfurivibrio alkaliphilus TaxID=427923 RepID=A0A7C2XAF3_9BACT|nr:CooT family nickel-binding protein [Desulfurivibrio alkaliphilus]
MCQMTVLLEKDGQEELVAEQASLLEAVENGVRIDTLFEAPRVVEGVLVARIDFLAGKVILRGKP